MREVHHSIPSPLQHSIPPSLHHSVPPLRLALSAMATRFEIVLHGDRPASLRAAAEEAFEEIEQLEAQLSQFRSGSEIAHLNARAAKKPVRVTPPLFALLQHCRKLHDETGG